MWGVGFGTPRVIFCSCGSGRRVWAAMFDARCTTSWCVQNLSDSRSLDIVCNFGVEFLFWSFQYIVHIVCLLDCISHSNVDLHSKCSCRCMTFQWAICAFVFVLCYSKRILRFWTNISRCNVKNVCCVWGCLCCSVLSRSRFFILFVHFVEP